MKGWLLNLVLVTHIGVAVAADACPPKKFNEVVAVSTAAAAVATAKAAMAKEYSPQYLAQYDPFRAELQGAVWHVYGYLPPNVVGGTPEAEVCRATGEIVGVYHAQ